MDKNEIKIPFSYLLKSKADDEAEDWLDELEKNGNPIDHANPKCIFYQVYSIYGIYGNGLAMSVMETNWEDSGRIELSKASAAFRAIGAKDFADNLAKLLSNFPEAALNDLRLREQWAWGEAEGSSRVPELVHDFDKHSYVISPFLTEYVLNNLKHFPGTARWLKEQINKLVPDK